MTQILPKVQNVIEGIGGDLIERGRRINKRRITQIAAIPLIDQHNYYETRVFALCSDGSVWVFNKDWQRLPEIPQD